MEKKTNDGVKMAELFSNMSNCNDRNALNDMLRELQHDHRFIQAQEIKNLLIMLKMFSQVGTDGRNEYEVNFLKKVVNFIESKEGLNYGELPNHY